MLIMLNPFVFLLLLFISRSKDETPPPKLEKINKTVPSAKNTHTPTAIKNDKPKPKGFSTPQITPTSSESKRPRKGTPYRVNRPHGVSKEEQEQRMRVSNLDRILQSQCHGTPVSSQSGMVGRSFKQTISESGQSSDNDVPDGFDHGPSTS